MTLPVGEISLSQVNTELALPATQVIGMNDAAVRTLAGVGGSGTVISMANLQGKSGSRVVISLAIIANVQNYDIYTNRGGTYQPGTSDITLTVSPGVFVGSTSTSTYALSAPNQFSPGDTVRIVNNGTILGAGGNGAATLPSSNIGPGQAGSAGGNALLVQRAVTVQNAGVIAGAGGGGGSGATGSVFSPRPGRQGGPFTSAYMGGTGGGGAGYNAGAAGVDGTAVNPPRTFTAGASQAGTLTTGGNGGTATAPGQAGGAGGGRGATGVTTSGSGGAAGYYVVGNANVTWQATGTQQGSVA
jgi:hypothetical protein